MNEQTKSNRSLCDACRPFGKCTEFDPEEFCDGAVPECEQSAEWIKEFERFLDDKHEYYHFRWRNSGLGLYKSHADEIQEVINKLHELKNKPLPISTKPHNATKCNTK